MHAATYWVAHTPCSTPRSEDANLLLHRASADVELHSDEESEAPEGSVSLSSTAEQQKSGLQIERSSVSEADMSASSGKPKDPGS